MTVKFWEGKRKVLVKNGVMFVDLERLLVFFVT